MARLGWNGAETKGSSWPHFSISLPNNEQVFDDKSGGEGWQNDAFGQL
jgi:hypothetical protein